MSRIEKEKQRQVQDKCQVILGQLLREEDNKYCVDCDAKGPRWASWNLGIFLCIRCAGIHRNLGVHISKVKSVNLDTWTPEQVGCLQQMGNSKARAVYEANLPDNFRRPQTDSSLEAFVRAKYEQKKYIAKEWIPNTTPKPAFDIEEEHRKEREKKKNRKTASSTPVEMPCTPAPSALPRPQSQNTKPAKSTATKAVTPTPSATFDLLGLDAPVAEPETPSEDPFEAFISAPLPVSTPSTATPNPSSIPNGTSSSSLDLAGVDVRKPPSMLSKESILSLYGTSGGVTQQQPTFGVPGGMYVAQPQPGYQWNNQVASASGENALTQPLTSLPNVNPFLATNSNGKTESENFARLAQIDHQMSGMSLGYAGPPPQQFAQWGVPSAPVVPHMNPNAPRMFQGPVPAMGGPVMMMVPPQQSGIVPGWGPVRPPPQGHTLSTNLWQ